MLSASGKIHCCRYCYINTNVVSLKYRIYIIGQKFTPGGSGWIWLIYATYPEWPNVQPPFIPWVAALARWLPRMLKVATLHVRIPAVAERHRFILCTRRSGGIAHEGGGCDQSIGSSVSDAIVRSWLWSTATGSSPLGYFSKLLQVVDNWPHILW